MKNMTKVLTLAGLFLAVASNSVFGQIFVTVDEYGTNTQLTFPGHVAVDPSGGIAAPVLIYNVPFGLVQGDLLLSEPNGDNAPSDVIRFWNPGALPNFSQIIFYSDLPSGPEVGIAPPADTGLPLGLLGNVTGPFHESGTEDNNFYVYNPAIASGLPGSSLGGVFTLYTIISDVPEPSTAALLLGGFGIFFGIKRFRKSGNN